MNTENVLEYGPRVIAPIRYIVLAVALVTISCGEDPGEKNENSTQPQAEWSEYEEVISEVVEGAKRELALNPEPGFEHQWEIISVGLELTLTTCAGEPIAAGVTEYEVGPTNENKCVEVEASDVSENGQWWLRVNERSRPL